MIEAMTHQYCKTCTHRDGYGYCRSKKLAERLNQRDEDPESADMMLYGYYEGGGFWVGPGFGCVHHTENGIDSHLAKARAIADDMRKKIADKVEHTENGIDSHLAKARDIAVWQQESPSLQGGEDVKRLKNGTLG